MVMFFVSLSILLFELSLLRSYAYLSYYHFGFLIISLALLGFSLSGVILRLFYEGFMKKPAGILDLLSAVLVVTIPLSLICMDRIQLNVLAFGVDPLQSAGFIFHALLLLPPFLAGALLIGFILSIEDRSGLFYGINLFGSGLGGGSVILLLLFISPEKAPMFAFFPAAAVCILRALRRPRSFRRTAALLLVLGAGSALCLSRGAVGPDQYKAVSTARLLEAQGEAENLGRVLLPAARIDAYASDHFHSHLFAGLDVNGSPPAQVQLYYDGEMRGTVLLPEKRSDLAFISAAPQSLAYRMVRPERVLLLGEKGNAGLYSASSLGAAEITVIRSSKKEMELVRFLGQEAAFGAPGCHTVISLPLQFLQNSEEKYSLIHLMAAEGFASTGTGMEMLKEEPLFTVEGFSSALARVDETGAISITRGIRLPPRDNLRIFATALDALERSGVQNPSKHLLAVRNHLAVSTILCKEEIPPEKAEDIAALCSDLGLEIIFLPHEPVDPGRRIIHGFPSPPGEEDDWYRYAARRLLSDRETFYNEYPYSIEPVGIDSPFFYFFPPNPGSREGSSPFFSSSSQGFSPGSSETAYRIILVSLILLAVIGFPLILLPGFFLKKRRSGVPDDLQVPDSGSEALALFLYAFLIGTAFMSLEYTFLHRFSLFLGHPVLGASAVISAFLIAAGGGSMSAEKSAPARTIIRAGLMTVGMVLLIELSWNGVTERLGGLGTAARLLVSMAICGFPAFYMGRMFPALIKHLRTRSPDWIPYVWGINGFASVVSGPLSMLVFLHLGFRAGSVMAALLYTGAAFLGMYLTRRRDTGSFSKSS